MAHYMNLTVSAEQDGKEVLSLLRSDLKLTTRKIRSVKYDPAGILLDGIRVTVREKVRAGQILSVLLDDSEKKARHIEPAEMELDILYEDEDLLFVNKPAGIVSHPSKSHFRDSLASGIRHYFDLTDPRSHVHLTGRLDKDTSGIICAAKNGAAKERMTALRRSGALRKEYLALVCGTFPSRALHGTIDIPMEIYRDHADRDHLKVRPGTEGAPDTFRAVTHYEVLSSESIPLSDTESSFDVSLLRLWLDTGRMHQIRFHMSAAGHPLVGDALYGTKTPGADYSGIPALSYAALHAWKESFPHPFTGRYMQIEAPLPEWARPFF